MSALFTKPGDRVLVMLSDISAAFAAAMLMVAAAVGLSQ
jgi:hypothetical protein